MSLIAFLHDNGFIRVTGIAVEHSFEATPYVIKKDTPLSYGENNGVLAVSDETGDVWIASAQSRSLLHSKEFHSLTRGLHVPLSNGERVLSIQDFLARVRDAHSKVTPLAI